MDIYKGAQIYHWIKCSSSRYALQEISDRTRCNVKRIVLADISSLQNVQHLEEYSSTCTTIIDCAVLDWFRRVTTARGFYVESITMVSPPGMNVHFELILVSWLRNHY